MYDVLGHFALISFIMIFVSLISPKLGSFGLRPDIKRWKLALIWFVTVWVFCLVGVAFTPDEEWQARHNAPNVEMPEKDMNSDKADPYMPEDDKKELQARNDASYVEMLEKGMNSDKAVATKNWEILRKLGFLEIMNVSKFGDTRYDVDFARPTVCRVDVTTDKDKNIEKVEFFGTTLYEKGEIKGNLKDHYLTKKETQDAFDFAEKAIKEDLNEPNSVRVKPLNAYKHDGIITIGGYVVIAEKLFKMWIIRLNAKTHDYYIDYKKTAQISHGGSL